MKWASYAKFGMFYAFQPIGGVIMMSGIEKDTDLLSVWCPLGLI